MASKTTVYYQLDYKGKNFVPPLTFSCFAPLSYYARWEHIAGEGLAQFISRNTRLNQLVDREGIEPSDSNLARIARYPIDTARYLLFGRWWRDSNSHCRVLETRRLPVSYTPINFRQDSWDFYPATRTKPLHFCASAKASWLAYSDPPDPAESVGVV